MIYFTSDTHFFHKNIIRYSNRPFADVDEMNREMVRRWNAVVKHDDIVYHLGDFAFANRRKTEELASQLNGTIHLIRGNHDPAWMRVDWKYGNSRDYAELNLDGQPIVLSHYAMRVWNRSHHGSIMLYGHSHGTLPGSNQSLDVGVDCWNYQPVSFAEIRERLATLPAYRNPDHHNANTN